jgi:hypothetical protein
VRVLIILLALVGVAHAYPQFQLSKDQTCAGCHLSPAGGGLLSENGLNVAETTSQFGTAPEFFYGKIPAPTWLSLGGDLRGAGGYFDSVEKTWETFPMQAEVYANATFSSVSLHVTAGLRDPQYDNTAKTLFASREHWVQWQQKPGESTGLFVRAGRFMPVFGLRLAEHPEFTRRYGGSPLYGEAYGLAVEYIAEKWEVHATGFVHDPFLTDSIEKGNGAALYAETRIAEKTAIGLEGKVDVTPDDKHWYGGVTAKQWLAPVLLQAEVQVVHQKVDAGGTANGVVGDVMASYFIGPVMIDLIVEAYDPNVRVRYLDQEAIDLNVHWFTTSHLELVLMNHLQMQELGEGGLSSGYSMLMVHYRL